MKFVILLTALISLATPSRAALINESLSEPEARAELDRLTRSPETYNKIEVLDNGLNSWPARQKLISEAGEFVFVMVPYWYYDTTGREVIKLLKERKRHVRGFELKVIQGWTSPFLSKGGGKVKDDLKDISDQYLLWNNPLWQRRFSFSLLKGHLHDKFLIVDGRKMILGGMNISDEDASGGVKAIGFRDTDLLIEGPGVHQATEIFLKINQLGHHLASPAHFPPFKDQEIKAFQSFFYENKEDHDFQTVTDEPNPKPPFMKNNRVHIPIRSLLKNPKYFPPVDAGPTPLRLIYDNAIIDRDPKTKKQYSKFFKTLEFTMSKARETVWITTPYLTFDRELMELFVSAAKVFDVRIVTNSSEATDRDLDYYKQQLSHYPTMLKAGIKLYEWSQKELEQAAKTCKVSAWPGQMMHHKMVLIDKSVVFVGSNNINRRSTKLNSEVMAMVNDETFARKFVDIFENEFNGEKQTVECPDGVREIPVVKEVSLDLATRLMRKLKVKKPVWNYQWGGA